MLIHELCSLVGALSHMRSVYLSHALAHSVSC